MATPVIASVSTYAGNESAGVTLSQPTGLSSGDLIVVLVASETANSNTWPSGSALSPDTYNDLQALHGNNNGDIQIHVYWREADGTETWPLVISDGNTNDKVAWCFRITGQDETTPIPTIGAWSGEGSIGDTLVVGSITPASDDLIIAFTGTDGSDLTPATISSGTGYTIQDTLEQPTDNANGTGASYATKTADGAASALTFGYGASDGRMGVQFAIGQSTSTVVTAEPTTGLVNTVGQAASVAAFSILLAVTGVSGTVGAVPIVQAIQSAVELAPATGVHVTVGYAPALEIDNTVLPQDGLETTVGYAPVVQNDNTLTPADGLIKTVGDSAALSIDNTVQVSISSQSVVGYAPIVEAGAIYEILPAGGVSVTVGSAPSLEVLNTFTVDALTGQTGTTGYAPTVTYETVLTVEGVTGVDEIVGGQASLAVDNSIVAQAGLESVTGYAPAVDAVTTSALAPDTGVVNIVGYVALMDFITIVTPDTGGAFTRGRHPELGVINNVYPVGSVVNTTGLAPEAYEVTILEPGTGVASSPNGPVNEYLGSEDDVTGWVYKTNNTLDVDADDPADGVIATSTMGNHQLGDFWSGSRPAGQRFLFIYKAKVGNKAWQFLQMNSNAGLISQVTLNISTGGYESLTNPGNVNQFSISDVDEDGYRTIIYDVTNPNASTWMIQMITTLDDDKSVVWAGDDVTINYYIKGTGVYFGEDTNVPTVAIHQTTKPLPGSMVMSPSKENLTNWSNTASSWSGDIVKQYLDIDDNVAIDAEYEEKADLLKPTTATAVHQLSHTFTDGPDNMELAYRFRMKPFGAYEKLHIGVKGRDQSVGTYDLGFVNLTTLEVSDFAGLQYDIKLIDLNWVEFTIYKNIGSGTFDPGWFMMVLGEAPLYQLSYSGDLSSGILMGGVSVKSSASDYGYEETLDTSLEPSFPPYISVDNALQGVAGNIKTTGETPFVTHGVYPEPDVGTISTTGYHPAVDTRVWIPTEEATTQWTEQTPETTAWSPISEPSTTWTKED